jgi:hypothetical protein
MSVRKDLRIVFLCSKGKNSNPSLRKARSGPKIRIADAAYIAATRRPKALLNAAKFAAVTVPISQPCNRRADFHAYFPGYLFAIGRCGCAGRATKLGMLQIEQNSGDLISPECGSREGLRRTEMCDYLPNAAAKQRTSRQP